MQKKWSGFLSVLLFTGGLTTAALATSVEVNTGGSSVYVGKDGVRVSAGNAAESDEGLTAWDAEHAPGDNYIHEEARPLGDERAVPGFWRVKEKPGFVWVEGRWQNDIYIPGFWRPAHARRGQVWIPGHWYGRRWIAGRWRPAFRPGYAWMEGHWTREGEWVEGFWMPNRMRRGDQVWEPGYWGPRGWVEGYWRVKVKPGHIWIAGERDEQGRWLPGHWQQADEHEVWVHGHWDHEGRYVAGRIERAKDRNSYHRGYYGHDGRWVEPRWEKEQDVHGAEHHPPDREYRREENRQDRRQGNDQGNPDNTNNQNQGDDNSNSREHRP